MPTSAFSWLVAGLFFIFLSASASAADGSLSSKIEEAINQYTAKHGIKHLTPADLKAIAAIAAGVASTSTDSPRPQHVAKTDKPGSTAHVAVTGAQSTLGAGVGREKSTTAAPEPTSTPSPLQFVVNKDFASVGVSVSQTDTSKTTGATFSFANDQVAKNSTWTAQAVGILAYHIDPCEPGSEKIGIMCSTFGLYGGLNKVSNSNPSATITSNGTPVSKSMDNVIWGGFAETAYQSSQYFQDFIRVKAGGVTNNIAQHTLFTIKKTTVTTTEAATQFASSLEWFPVYDFRGTFLTSALPCLSYAGFNKAFSVSTLFCSDHEFGPRISLIPELYLEYNNTFDTTQILAFSNKSSAFRAGPQVGLLVVPFPHADHVLQGWALENLSIYTVYHFFHEFVSAKSNYVFQTNLNYKFPKTFGAVPGIANDLGLSFQYQRGANENTGQRANIYTIGLTGSLCWGGYCGGGSSSSGDSGS